MGQSSSTPHRQAPGTGSRAGSRRSVDRARLDRDAVVGAALAFIDEHGLDGLTMRRLGALMGVEAMSIYHHVPSREALLEAVVDRVVAEMAAAPDPTPEPAGWRDLLARLAHGVRRVALAHPHAFVLVASRPAEAPWLRPPLRTMEWAESFLDALRQRGFSDAGAVAAYRAFTSVLVGHLLLEVAPHVMAAASPGVGDVEEELAEHPTLVRLSASLAADHGAEELDDALEQLFAVVAVHEHEPAG